MSPVSDNDAMMAFCNDASIYTCKVSVALLWLQLCAWTIYLMTTATHSSWVCILSIAVYGVKL